MASPFRPGVLGLAVVLSLGACAEDVCDAERMPTCDIRQEGCQQTVVDMVACLRGDTVTETPPVTVISPEELEARLRGGADPMMMETLQLEGALHQLGMLDADASLFEAAVADRVAGTRAFFSSTENAVYVVDRGEPADSVEVVGTLLHEMVHAVQHQEHDLFALAAEAETHEALLRARLAVEGEATFYQLEALAWSEGHRADEIDWDAYFDGWVARTQSELDEGGSPFFVVYRRFPYVLGARHAAGRWVVGGDEAVRALPATPPEASLAFLRDPWSGHPPLPRRLRTSPCDAPPPPPAGYDRALREEMGAPFLYAFLRAGRRLSHLEARSHADRWQRDELFVYGGPDGRVAVAWRIFTEDEDTARALEADVLERGFRAAAALGTVTLVATPPGEATGWSWDAPSPECALP
ncbi:MAG TPA: hypothetical protein RMH99_25805 [Sandaracinaceae bacterium LLY-WYZ-13_1]|nr:hypothetical protein [Sandaracinaceae bacterium LLY-WYZ-13_1]